MSVLFHGYFGMGNTGDEAVLSVLINEYRGYGYEPLILSANPERSRRLHGVYACREKLFSLTFWRSFMRCSRIVFAGGGRYGEPTLRRMALLTILAKLLGKGVEHRAVGLYPYQWRGSVTLYSRGSLGFLARCMLKLALRLADKITVRDMYSKRFIEGTITGRRIILKLDPSLKLKPNIRNAEKVLRSLGLSEGDVIIGLNLRFLRGRVFARVLYSIVRALAKYLEDNKHVKLLYIPFGYGSFPDRFFDDDLRIGYLIGRYLQGVSGNRYYVLSQELKPSTILGVFKLVKAVICVRYHALVFAHMCGTPVLSIAYDTKVLEFAELVNRLGRRIVGRVVKPESVSVDIVLSFLRRYVG